jgi:hypothetical protein
LRSEISADRRDGPAVPETTQALKIALVHDWPYGSTNSGDGQGHSVFVTTGARPVCSGDASKAGSMPGQRPHTPVEELPNAGHRPLVVRTLLIRMI